MQRFYLVPIEIIPNPAGGDWRGPMYFRWRFNESGIDCAATFMNYGASPYMLVLAHDITQPDHDALVLNADIYSFPEMLDQSIAPGDNLDTFFESIGIPTDWLTPSTTYRQFARQLAAMFIFNQRYWGLTGGSLVDDVGGLNIRFNSWSAQARGNFLATLASFGYDQTISGNPSLRQLMKRAGDAWGDTPFVMDGVEF